MLQAKYVLTILGLQTSCWLPLYKHYHTYGLIVYIYIYQRHANYVLQELAYISYLYSVSTLFILNIKRFQ